MHFTVKEQPVIGTPGQDLGCGQCMISICLTCALHCQRIACRWDPRARTGLWTVHNFLMLDTYPWQSKNAHHGDPKQSSKLALKHKKDANAFKMHPSYAGSVVYRYNRSTFSFEVWASQHEAVLVSSLPMKSRERWAYDMKNISAKHVPHVTYTECQAQNDSIHGHILGTFRHNSFQQTRP